MYPLIEIKTVPIEIQMKTRQASLEYTRGTAEMEISRSDKGLDIKSRNIKVQLDTFEKGGAQSPSARNGAVSQPTYEATSAAVSQQGSILMNARIGQESMEPAVQSQPQPQFQSQSQAQLQSQGQSQGSVASQADIALKTGVNVQWEDGAMQIRYEMDKMNFDWKIDQGEFKFTPGDIEISVKQQPDVIIKYVGGPIYVPPSADPNYEPVDVKA